MEAKHGKKMAADPRAEKVPEICLMAGLPPQSCFKKNFDLRPGPETAFFSHLRDVDKPVENHSHSSNF